MSFFVGCQKDDVSKPVETRAHAGREFAFNFINGAQGWVDDFSDYPDDPDGENFYELKFSHSTLPSPLNSSDGA